MAPLELEALSSGAPSPSRPESRSSISSWVISLGWEEEKEDWTEVDSNSGSPPMEEVVLEELVVGDWDGKEDWVERGSARDEERGGREKDEGKEGEEVGQQKRRRSTFPSFLPFLSSPSRRSITPFLPPKNDH